MPFSYFGSYKRKNETKKDFIDNPAIISSRTVVCQKKRPYKQSVEQFLAKMRGTKKSRKNKGTVLSLNNFLGDAPQGTINVIKKVTNVEGDYSDDDGSNTKAVIVQLPTAPKAQRVFDDHTLPHKPPFIARINNLPFDADEDDVYDLCTDILVKSVSLPREDGETGRIRGFGRLELDSRDDLIHVLSLPEPTIRGRRVRIEIFNQNEYGDNRAGGGSGNRRHYSNFGDSDTNRESTNWRQDSRVEESTNRDTGGGWPELNESRSIWTQRKNRDGDTSSWRQERTQTNNEAGGSWRSGNRPSNGDFSAWRDNTEGAGSSGGNRRRNYGRNDNIEYRERKWQGKTSPTEQQTSKMSLNDDERPKLKLLPRQLPLPVIINTAEQKTSEVESPSSEEESKDSIGQANNQNDDEAKNNIEVPTVALQEG